MRRYRYVGLLVVSVAVISESAGAARISSLPTTITTRKHRQLPPLWGIRGGADDTQEKDDVEEDQDITLNDIKEQEEVVVLTTEGESSATEEEVSLDTDHDVGAADVSLVMEEEESEDEEEESTEESTETVVEEEEEKVHVVVDDEALVTAREQAQELRQHGKDLHDEGDWQEAAVKFYEASTRLQDYVHDEDILQEYATCRLHEALCRLKIHDYEQSVEACTAVLDREPPAAIRARALHRRSRAKLGLGLEDEALLDARQAAFLGDRKAVALYGKLMRQDSSGSENSSLQDLFQGGGSNLFLSSGDTQSSSTSSALLESLLNKSSDSGGAPPSNPMSMFMNGGNKNGGGGGLAKSVLSSLSKTVENESTQENICRYLQNANVGQVRQMAAMAGFPLSKSHASRLVSFCHGVTPKGIRKSVKTTKRLWYVVSLLRKVAQIISKYRFVLILWALSAWIKSAVRRPIPINKRAARLAIKQAMKQGAV